MAALEPLRLTEAHPDQHLKVARRLIKAKNYAAARDLIAHPLTDSDDESRRLRLVAKAWSEEDRHVEAAECLRLAYALRPDSRKVVAAYLSELAIVGNYRTALRVHDDLPRRDQRRREILWEMHFLYKWLGWAGNADLMRRAAEVPTDLSDRLAVAVRRIIRPLLLRIEARQRVDLLQFDKYFGTLRAIKFQSVDQRYEFHSDVDDLMLAWSRTRAWLGLLNKLLRVLYPIVMGAALVLFLLFGSDVGSVVLRLPMGIAGAGLMYLAGRKLWDMTATYSRATVATGSFGLCGLIAGTLLLRFAAGNGFLTMVGVTLLGGAVIVIFSVLGGLVLGGVDGYVEQRVSRRNARAAVSAHLIEVIARIGEPSGRGLGGYWLWKLETAARLLEHRLPRQVRTYDQRTAAWLDERCAGAAEALRHMKLHVLSPAGASWEHLSRLLHQQLAALATGNWHNLVWRQPPGKEARSKRDTLISAVRVVVVAFLPAGSLFALSPWLDFGDGIFRWARLVVFGWALLSVLLALDPGVRERIEMAVLLARGSDDKSKPDRG